jgi:hypothetical protein
MKKGFIFSLDSFFAIILFVFVIFLIYVFSIYSYRLDQQYFFSDDLLNSFSEVKINELNLNNYPNIKAMTLDPLNKINDTDITLTEQIVTFQLNDKPDDINNKDNVKLFISDILAKFGNENMKTAIYLGEQLVYNENPEENVANILTRTRLAVGKK